MDRRNLSAAERTIGYLLRLPYETLSQQVYGALAGEGFPDIRPAHSAVFRHVERSGSRVSDLAQRASLTKQSLSYLVEDLAASGYVTLVPDPTDGRAKLVCLSARGHEVSRALLRLSRKVEDDFAARLGPAKMARLRALLAELADVLEASGPPSVKRRGQPDGLGPDPVDG